MIIYYYSFVNSAYINLALEYYICHILLPLLKSVFEHPVIIVDTPSYFAGLIEIHITWCLHIMAPQCWMENQSKPVRP